ncbi:hypothetical protein [Methylobacterium sp. XJLW]|uniref:hypothetical protein n=1 Tax=Methylobacterium sp. XJLW TaxID=739141 RepID=UPI00197B379C|nr:hypothetical protein [Methylobacterium sp. XJLW]
MARGGARTGAGRKPGSLTKRTREVAEALMVEGVTPLEIMLGAARAVWTEATKGERIDLDKAAAAASIAKDAAPYVHPKLASIEHTGKDGKDLIPEASPDDVARRLAFMLASGAAAQAPTKD